MFIHQYYKIHKALENVINDVLLENIYCKMFWNKDVQFVFIIYYYWFMRIIGKPNIYDL